MPTRLLLPVIAQGIETVWALINSLVAFEVSAWVGVGFGLWAALGAVACVITPRRRGTAIILSAGLQAAVVALGAISLIAAPDVRAVGAAYLFVGSVLLWAFLGAREQPNHGS